MHKKWKDLTHHIVSREQKKLRITEKKLNRKNKKKLICRKLYKYYKNKER